MSAPEKEGPGDETEAKTDGVDQSCCTSSQESGQKQDASLEGPVERILGLLGPCVLLRVPYGGKECYIDGWPRLRAADMTPNYLAALNHGSNIGVSLGEASGNLISVDTDSDGLFEEFLELNPALRESLISKSGSRAGNVWLRMKGEYPHRSGVFRIDGQDVGEWRANGNQTIIHGQHPSGSQYCDNGKRPIEIEFSEIRWPERMTLPWLKKAAQSNDSSGGITRPGVSEEFLKARGVRHVEAEEAYALLGFWPRGGGLWIPYFSQEGGPLMVEGREYGRLRLDKPSGDAKYLSPKGSGAQLYVPTGVFGNETVCEGEFKALALCAAGVAAVAIGGVSSAMPGGELLPDLKKLFSKFPGIEKVYFQGDVDTALSFEFSREAVKLAGALPEGVRLPRIPFGEPNGIDDCREKAGEGFLEFWEEIKARAVEVSGETDASTIAAELLIRELSAIGKLGDWKKKYLPKIVELAGRLEPVALDEVARAAKEHLRISIGAFKDQAARTATRLLPSSLVELPKIYFDGVVYYRENEGKSGFESIGREDAMLELRKIGFPHRTARGTETSPCEDALRQLQMANRVDYTGPFCGRPAGLYREKEVTILCTRGPVIIEGKPGDAGPVKVFLESLLGKGRDSFFEKQRPTFSGWLKHARTALRRHEQDLPGQVLGLVGPRDCGKSLLQTIITMCLGGREADPSLYLVKGNDFNSEMWCAEHLRLGDEELMEDGRSGVHKLRERLKKAAVATLYPFHAKRVDAKNARPIWRLSISGNDDSESIAVLPPPTDSFSDKVSYLQCYAPVEPYHDGSAEGRNTFWKRLMGALPAFLWEVDNLELPEELRDSRFFVKAWHHPRVVELIEDASPVAPLGELLASVIEKQREGKPLEGSATEIYKELGPVLSGIVSNAAHFGHMVKRLQKLEGWKNYVGCYEVRIGLNKQKQTIWKIAAPSDDRF